LIECYEELVSKPHPDDPAERQQDYLRLYAIVLGLGDQPFSQIPSGVRDDLTKKLREQYGMHPSRAVHSALGWTLRQWGKHDLVKQVDHTEIPIDPTLEREWYIAKATPNISPSNPEFDYGAWTAGDFYLTMLVFKPDSEPSKSQTGQTPSPFAISDRETTWEQFRPFNPSPIHSNDKDKTPLSNPDEPVSGEKWSDTVDYLNWLTISSGLPASEKAYLDIHKSYLDEKPPTLFETVDRPVRRSKRGFRLPNKLEWVHAVRSGVDTDYPFGSDVKLSIYYAWSRENSQGAPHSVCELRPNLSGLFDANGNLIEWVQDLSEEEEENFNRERQLLGGSFEDRFTRIERVWHAKPGVKYNDHGFRVVQSVLD
jgi:hypothetical protein